MLSNSTIRVYIDGPIKSPGGTVYEVKADYKVGERVYNGRVMSRTSSLNYAKHEVKHWIKELR